MRRLAAALLAGLIAASAQADPQADAAAAVGDLRKAAELLSEAETARDRVRALTEAIHAYEAGLGSMRDALRRAALRDREIRARLDAESEQLARLLGALAAMEGAPDAGVLLHPSGPLATARAGMLAASVTPALTEEVRRLTALLEETQMLAALQADAARQLQAGLEGAQAARAELGQAISDRVQVETSATDQVALQALVNSAETLQGFAESLTSEPPEATTSFSSSLGALPWPADVVLLASYGEEDRGGIRRPGVLLGLAPRTLVQAPWEATVRFAGPLLDYGGVVVLEPESGYLIVLAGLGELLVGVGEVVTTGAPIGLMTGTVPEVQDILIETQGSGGQVFSETLYIEVRQGPTPTDPVGWFGAAQQ